jgi:hypothetical protein
MKCDFNKKEFLADLKRKEIEYKITIDEYKLFLFFSIFENEKQFRKFIVTMRDEKIINYFLSKYEKYKDFKKGGGKLI